MRDRLRKAVLYGRPEHRYWRLAVAPSPSKRLFRPYPIDFELHLRAGHYSERDVNGIPAQSRRGVVTHNYTRVSGFALAHLQAYQRTMLKSHLWEARRAGDYIVRTASNTAEEGMLLRAEVPDRGHRGPVSAMSQGQGMSVLTRLFEITADERYITAAEALLPAFRRTISDGGVRSWITPQQLWFEEDVTPPLRHILNGMIFALWGLSDVSSVTGSPMAGEHYREGLHSLKEVASRFDAGWWSYYDIADDGPPRLASANYHQLHYCQLLAIARAEGAVELMQLSRRFSEYERRPGNRLRAAVSLGAVRVRAALRARARS